MAQAGAAEGVLKDSGGTTGVDVASGPARSSRLSQCKRRGPNGGLRIKTMYPRLPVANIQEKY